jgi:hypothetical protein
MKHYLRFLVGPTLTVSVTVVAGRLLASPVWTNCPVRASRTLVDVFDIFINIKLNIKHFLSVLYIIRTKLFFLYLQSKRC